MTCYHPIDAWPDEQTGQLSFTEKATSRNKIQIPCGRCIGCRRVRVRDWAVRCMHEAQMHKQNCFITLTYDDEHYKPGLEYEDFRLFMRRVRKHKGKTRFFAAGEYGSENLRPHWHALLFGQTFTDLTVIGKDRYQSNELKKLWPHGFNNVGEINYTTAAYVAKYAIKKVSGPQAAAHYTRVHLNTGEIIQVAPEKARMSLNPGIGKTWIEKYWKEVYQARDGIVLKGGHQIPAPRYYDTQLKKISPQHYTDKDVTRGEQIKANAHEQTPERLKAREQVAIATIKHNTRTKL